jgi:hypothetical protein
MPSHRFEGFTEVKDSTHMDGFRYDPVARKLTVRYRNGYVYEASGVSPEEHKAFAEAPSQGAHWHWAVKNSHDVVRVK